MMNTLILSARELKEWDNYTIENGNISLEELVEKAATACSNWIQKNISRQNSIQVFCGPGNNGSDGLALCRLLLQKGYKAEAVIISEGERTATNLKFENQLRSVGGKITDLVRDEDFSQLTKPALVIDAILGSGINRKVNGIFEKSFDHINRLDLTVISIDLPSGISAEGKKYSEQPVKATQTLSFQVMKPAVLLADTQSSLGNVHILDIGLHSGFIQHREWTYKAMNLARAKTIYKPRNPFVHKGSQGHALLIGGSFGKMGALVLASKACLNTGAGLTTAFIPRHGNLIMQTAVPEVMTIPDSSEDSLTNLTEISEKYSAIGIGPGMGTDLDTGIMFEKLLKSYNGPLVIDADGLNLLSLNKSLFNTLNGSTILTPHPKEFDRLFGEQEDEYSRIEKSIEMARTLGITIVLKGPHSFIATAEGEHYFNLSGNEGLAKGGSGDVLTGIITSLLAQGYKASQAALLGVFIHGLSADLAKEKIAVESMNASDVIAGISTAFFRLGN